MPNAWLRLIEYKFSLDYFHAKQSCISIMTNCTFCSHKIVRVHSWTDMLAQKGGSQYSKATAKTAEK